MIIPLYYWPCNWLVIIALCLLCLSCLPFVVLSCYCLILEWSWSWLCLLLYFLTVGIVHQLYPKSYRPHSSITFLNWFNHINRTAAFVQIVCWNLLILCLLLLHFKVTVVFRGAIVHYLVVLYFATLCIMMILLLYF